MEGFWEGEKDEAGDVEWVVLTWMLEMGGVG